MLQGCWSGQKTRQTALEIVAVYRYYVCMTAMLSFRDAGHPDFFEGFSCDIAAGCTALLITSREDESIALKRIITGLSPLLSGSLLIDGQDTSRMDQADLCRLRRRIGVIPGNGGLVSNLKLWENITLPLLYHAGRVTPDDEKKALDYLAGLGYSGSVMALPAHLTIYEKRMAAMVRTFLCKPPIVLYCDCFEGISPSSRTSFFQAATGFHAAAAGRTSLYLTSSPELAADLAVDRVITVSGATRILSRKT
jgi:phospholipid/cholesterol/gamma-HCH transport system ATP-binding protein